MPEFPSCPRAAVIADAYSRLDFVLPHYAATLDAVAKNTGETTYLSVWRHVGVKILATAEGEHAVRVVGLTTGYSMHLHARASGKLLLGYMSPAIREAIVANMPFNRLTNNTITNREDFLHELQDVRKTGIAFDREEFQEGVTCVSSPILGSDNAVACITISAPTPRFIENQRVIIHELTTTALSLSTAEAVPDETSTEAKRPEEQHL